MFGSIALVRKAKNSVCYYHIILRFKSIAKCIANKDIPVRLYHYIRLKNSRHKSKDKNNAQVNPRHPENDSPKTFYQKNDKAECSLDTVLISGEDTVDDSCCRSILSTTETIPGASAMWLPHNNKYIT